jgi:hypothetical protein
MKIGSALLTGIQVPW